MDSIITPTRAEKLEWARMAQAAYAANLNAVGHRYSRHAAIPDSAALRVAAYDQLQRDYRAWLVDGTFPVLA